MKESGLTVDKIINLANNQSEKEIGLDEMFGWYLNITWALLFVFIIASFLYWSELRKEVDQTKDERDYIQAQWDAVKDNPDGKQYQLRETTLIELQKLELLKALDELEAEDRKVFGLSIFSSAEQAGRVLFNIKEIISGDKISGDAYVNKYFVEGSILAKKRLPYLEKYRDEWLELVLEKSKKRLLKDGEMVLPIANDSTIVEKSNQVWLLEEINRRTGTIYTEYCDFQGTILTHIYRYYSSSPNLLVGTEAGKISNKYFGADPEIQISLLGELQEKIWQQAKITLEKQGVMILSGAQE